MPPPFRRHQIIHSAQHPHPSYNYRLQRRVNPALLGLLTKSNAEELVLQALVVLGGKTPDGSILEAVLPAWDEIARLLKDDPDVLHKIPPRKMEEIIAGVYERAGWSAVILTPRSGDLGRDVIAERNDLKIRFIEQVKAYKPGHLVTATDVRELGFVLQADQNTSKGIVTTTSDFAPRISTDRFIKPFLPNRLELINGKQLRKRITDLIDNK